MRRTYRFAGSTVNRQDAGRMKIDTKNVDIGSKVEEGTEMRRERATAWEM
jgi:hypothetical protein